jgi:hypothetical protein
MPLFFAFVITPTLKSSHKPRQLAPTVGLTRSSFVRAMSFQSTIKFLPGSKWVLGSLLFIPNMFGDLILQELESCKVIRSDTSCLPPAPVRVGLVSEAQLRHGSIQLGKMDSNPSGDKVDHTLAVPVATTDPIY